MRERYEREKQALREEYPAVPEDKVFTYVGWFDWEIWLERYHLTGRFEWSVLIWLGISLESFSLITKKYFFTNEDDVFLNLILFVYDLYPTKVYLFTYLKWFKLIMIISMI